MRAEFLLALLLSAPYVLPQSQTRDPKGGMLDPDRTFSNQSVTASEFTSLLKDTDSDLAQLEKSIGTMRPDSLAVEYREGKNIDDNREYSTLAVEGTRRLIVSVLEKNSLRSEIQLLLSLSTLDGGLADFASFLSNLNTPNQNDARIALGWADELAGFRKKLIFRTPRIEFYVLGRAEQLDPPGRK